MENKAVTFKDFIMCILAIYAVVIIAIGIFYQKYELVMTGWLLILVI